MGKNWATCAPGFNGTPKNNLLPFATLLSQPLPKHNHQIDRPIFPLLLLCPKTNDERCMTTTTRKINEMDAGSWRGDRLSLISSSTSFRACVPCLHFAGIKCSGTNGWARDGTRALPCYAGHLCGLSEVARLFFDPPEAWPSSKRRALAVMVATENGDEACQGEKCLAWDFGTYFLPPSANAHTFSHC